MNDEQFGELSRKLDTLIALTAVNAVSGKSLSEQVSLLDSIGLRPFEIATILNKPSNLIRATLSKKRKRKTEVAGD